jgi:hypothetical protein
VDDLRSCCKGRAIVENCFFEDDKIELLVVADVAAVFANNK